MNKHNTNTTFLDTVYDLAAQNMEDYAMDIIFDHIDDLLLAGKFEDCDQILSDIDITRIPSVLMISFLTITIAAKSKLKNRDTFFNIVQQFEIEQQGEEATQNLLKGL